MHISYGSQLQSQRLCQHLIILVIDHSSHTLFNVVSHARGLHLVINYIVLNSHALFSRVSHAWGGRCMTTRLVVKHIDYYSCTLLNIVYSYVRIPAWLHIALCSLYFPTEAASTLRPGRLRSWSNAASLIALYCTPSKATCQLLTLPLCPSVSLG